MPVFNTQSRKAEKSLVSPSSRDSISGWLDVLTSMLSLSESQRVQVRDELEDHLRSRVDDLLITGTAEPEAVRIAVAELGETAELAKLISHAHTRTNPRRRMMNIALITAAVAGLSIGGYSMQNTAGTVVGENGGALVLADTSGDDDGKVHAFDLEMVPASAVLSEIARSFDRSSSFSRGAMSSEGRGSLEVLSAQFAGQFTFDQAIEEFGRQFDEVSYGYNLEITADSVLYQTAEEFERKRIEMRIYPSPVWLSKSSERQSYAISLVNLLNVKHNLKYASIEVIDEAIVVAATPEIHKEVLRFSAELNAVIERRNEERRVQNTLRVELRNAEQEQRRAEESERNAKSAVEFEKTVNTLQSEFNNARKALLASQEKLRQLKYDASTEKLNGLKEGASREKISPKIGRLMKSINELELEVDENKERYMYLRGRLLDSEYAALFAGLG